MHWRTSSRPMPSGARSTQGGSRTGTYATLPANSILTTREPDITPEDREFAVVASIIAAVALLCLGIGSVYLLLSTQL